MIIKHPVTEPLLTVEVRDEAAGVTVEAVGEIDMATAWVLGAALRHALLGRPAAVGVSLARVSYCGVAGARVLMRFHEDALRAGVEVLVDASQPVERILELFGAYRSPRAEPVECAGHVGGRPRTTPDTLRERAGRRSGRPARADD